MPNPGGGNQFGNYQLQPAYGDVKKQTQLTRAAPISGAPYAAQALNTPRRSQKRSQGVRAAPTATQTPSQGEPAMPPETPQLPPDRIYKSIASIPGASPLVQEIFGGRG